MTHGWRRGRRPRAEDDAALRRLRLLNAQLAGDSGEATTDRATSAATTAADARPTVASLAFGQIPLPPPSLDPTSGPRQGTVTGSRPESGVQASSRGADVAPAGNIAVGADAASDVGADAAVPARAVGGSGHSGVGRHAARSLSWQRRLVGALLDRAPTGAIGLTSTHVTVLALVGVGAVLVALWWLTGARPRPAPATEAAIVQPAPVAEGASGVEEVPETGSAESAGPGGATGSASPSGAPPVVAPGTPASAPAEVVVDVAGKVRRPGIVVLPAGARVADALEAAGGLRPAADTAGLNLARPLQDGEQVLVGLQAVAVPTASAPPDPSASTGTPALVNLNTATMEQLDTLPGIGPVTAQSILDWRAEHTAFSSVDELLEVDGIGDATLADLRDLVTV